jgi:hypothetical protein
MEKVVYNVGIATIYAAVAIAVSVLIVWAIGFKTGDEETRKDGRPLNDGQGEAIPDWFKGLGLTGENAGSCGNLEENLKALDVKILSIDGLLGKAANGSVDPDDYGLK